MRQRMQASDALRIALEMERRGHQLYVRAKSLSQDVALSDLLDKLAEDEMGHFFHFQDMLKAVDPDGAPVEDLALAGALAAGHFYPGGLMQTAMEGGLASVRAMLGTAIQSEQDAIAFYEELYQDAAPEHRPILRSIIQEEHRHYFELSERLKLEGAPKDDESFEKGC